VEAANRKGISGQGRLRLRPGEPDVLKGTCPVRSGAVGKGPSSRNHQKGFLAGLKKQRYLAGRLRYRGASAEKSAIMTFVEDFWVHFLQNREKIDGIRMPLDLYYECLCTKSTFLWFRVIWRSFFRYVCCGPVMAFTRLHKEELLAKALS